MNSYVSLLRLMRSSKDVHVDEIMYIFANLGMVRIMLLESFRLHIVFSVSKVSKDFQKTKRMQMCYLS